MPRSSVERTRKKAEPKNSRWQRWVLQPAAMFAGLALLLAMTGAAVATANSIPLGRELAAVVGYTSWMIVLLFYPGRGNPGYNPFGTITRRVWKPLLRQHAMALAILIPASALLVYLHSRLPPSRWFVAISVVLLLALSLKQYLPSADLLQSSALEQRKAAS